MEPVGPHREGTTREQIIQLIGGCTGFTGNPVESIEIEVCAGWPRPDNSIGKANIPFKMATEVPYICEHLS